MIHWEDKIFINALQDSNYWRKYQKFSEACPFFWGGGVGGGRGMEQGRHHPGIDQHFWHL